MAVSISRARSAMPVTWTTAPTAGWSRSSATASSSVPLPGPRGCRRRRRGHRPRPREDGRDRVDPLGDLARRVRGALIRLAEGLEVVLEARDLIEDGVELRPYLTASLFGPSTVPPSPGHPRPATRRRRGDAEGEALVDRARRLGYLPADGRVAEDGGRDRGAAMPGCRATPPPARPSVAGWRRQARSGDDRCTRARSGVGEVRARRDRQDVRIGFLPAINTGSAACSPARPPSPCTCP